MAASGRISPTDFDTGCVALFEHGAECGRNAPLPFDLRLVRLGKSAYSLPSQFHLASRDGDTDYHAIYSPVFQVPVMYIVRAQHPVLHCTFSREGQLGYEEHPVTGLPCVYMHPCQTAQIMDEMGPCGPAEYLARWFVLYARLAGLCLPASFAARVLSRPPAKCGDSETRALL